jgi:hypothetical protein
MQDIALPPAIRRIQQSWYWQYAGLPIIIALSVAALPCMIKGIQYVEWSCLIGAINYLIVSSLTTIISGHSVGSSSFTSSGSVNKPVENIIEIQKIAETSPVVADPIVNALNSRTTTVLSTLKTITNKKED